MKKLSRRTIREYAESLAIAFVLAMVIRHFVVEAFRIPTSSMEPTLIGRSTGGDRIVVSKLEYNLPRKHDDGTKTTGPQRWSVSVFKVDQNRIDYHHHRLEDASARMNPNGTVDYDGDARHINYVKRIVGLPGERIQLRNGDIFINGVIARKPEELVRKMNVPLTDKAQPLSNNWAAVAGSATVSGGNTLELNGSEADVEVEFRAEELDDIAADLKLKIQVEHTGGAGYLYSQLGKNDIVYSFYLPYGKEGEKARILRNGETVAEADFTAALTGVHTVEFFHVDATSTLYVDGKKIISYESDAENEISAASLKAIPQRSIARFGASGSNFTVSGISVSRDIFYTTDRSSHKFAIESPLTLGDDEYFMLGDNSSNSFDSRNWGVVKQAALLGEAFFVFWPPQRWHFIN